MAGNGISAAVMGRLGAARTLAVVISGQMLASLIIDQLGRGVPQHSVTLVRLVGAGCVMAGAVSVRF
jgi:bacterial/archaeal transporter family-2 protein